MEFPPRKPKPKPQFTRAETLRKQKKLEQLAQFKGKTPEEIEDPEKKATQEEFKYEHAQENIVRPLPIILSVEEQRRKEEEERLRKEEEERKLKEKYDGMDPLMRRRLAKSITFNGIYEGLDMGDR